MPNISQSYLEAIDLARRLNDDIFHANDEPFSDTPEVKAAQIVHVSNLTKLLTDVEALLAAAKPSAVR